MTSNPYQSPTMVDLEPSPERVVAPSAASTGAGVAQADYEKYRRGVVLLIVTIATFFFFASVEMFQNAMFVESAIASMFWLAQLACVRPVLKHRTATEAELSLEKYREVCSVMRQLCFGLGPVMVVVGGLQIRFVPTPVQFNALGFIVSGVAAFCCGFLWPRVAGNDTAR